MAIRVSPGKFWNWRSLGGLYAFLIVLVAVGFGAIKLAYVIGGPEWVNSLICTTIFAAWVIGAGFAIRHRWKERARLERREGR